MSTIHLNNQGITFAGKFVSGQLCSSLKTSKIPDNLHNAEKTYKLPQGTT